jgi:hypothetical protein
MFKVQSFVNAGTDAASAYNFTIDFANDMSIKVFNGLSTLQVLIQQVHKRMCFKISFSGNASLN